MSFLIILDFGISIVLIAIFEPNLLLPDSATRFH